MRRRAPAAFFLREAKIEKIKADFDKPQNRCAAHEFKKLCDKTANISLDTNEKLQKNFSPKILEELRRLHLTMALYGDKESARIAIDAVKKYIRDIRYENYFDFSRPIDMRFLRRARYMTGAMTCLRTMISAI